MGTTERSIFKYECLNGSRVRTGWYKRLQSITTMPLPARFHLRRSKSGRVDIQRPIWKEGGKVQVVVSSFFALMYVID